MLRKKLFTLVGLFLLCGFFVSNVVLAEELDGKSIIATVNGTPIEYKQIKLPEFSAIRIFEADKKRLPKSGNDFLELKRIIREKENDAFGRAIINAIRDEQNEKYQITATPEEIESEMGSMYPEGYLEKNLKEHQKSMIPVVTAIKAVREAGMNKDEAYKKFFENKGAVKDRRHWEEFLEMADTPESIADLENFALHLTIEDHKKNLVPMIEESVFNNKLNQIIERELIDTDPEFNDYLSVKNKSGLGMAEHKYGDFYEVRKKNSWWLKRVKKAEINIKVPEFESALEMLIEKLNK